jgi:hypothetical protein
MNRRGQYTGTIDYRQHIISLKEPCFPSCDKNTNIFDKKEIPPSTAPGQLNLSVKPPFGE